MKEEFKDIIWTYGSHEPMSMYLRGRRRSTAGLKGGARWIPAWHHFFDSEENVKAMAAMGFNYLHCRFYKGMGWEFEKNDFPPVVAFTEMCHKAGIKVLGYVQFGTLYYEHMKYEIPDLEDWASRDSQGNVHTYGGGGLDYYRWMPCMTQEKFWSYLERMIRIGVVEAHFDGIMMDNCLGSGCCCPRCKARFREYLKAHLEPGDCGLRGFDFVEPPSPVACQRPELEDPVAIAWRDFQAELMHDGLKRLYDYTKSLGSHLVFTGNVAAIARVDAYKRMGVDYFRMADCFDFLLDQNGNEPMILSNGAIITRARDTLMAEAAERDIFVLTDGSGDVTSTAPELYGTSLMEAKVLQTFAADRIMMIPEAGGGHRWECDSARCATLSAYRQVASMHRDAFYAEHYAPVALIYSVQSQHYSTHSYEVFMSAEEVLFRRHVPFRLVVADGRELAIPDGCKTLLVMGSRCLSDADVAAIAAFSDRGGTVIADEMSGVCDEENRELGCDRLAAIGGIARVSTLKPAIPSSGWRLEVLMPENGGCLADALPALPFRISAPETVFVRVNRQDGRWLFHFINYSAAVCDDAVIEFSDRVGEARCCTFAEPSLEVTEIIGGHRVSVPSFTTWAMAEIRQDG